MTFIEVRATALRWAEERAAGEGLREVSDRSDRECCRPDVRRAEAVVFAASEAADDDGEAGRDHPGTAGEGCAAGRSVCRAPLSPHSPPTVLLLSAARALQSSVQAADPGRRQERPACPMTAFSRAPTAVSSAVGVDAGSRDSDLVRRAVGPQPVVTVSMGGVTVDCLVDLGSQVSMIDRGFLPAKHGTKLHARLGELAGDNGRQRALRAVCGPVRDGRYMRGRHGERQRHHRRAEATHHSGRKARFRLAGYEHSPTSTLVSTPRSCR